MSIPVKEMLVCVPLLGAYCTLKVLFRSAVDDNSMLKERFAIPVMMMSSLPKFGNLTNNLVKQ